MSTPYNITESNSFSANIPSLDVASEVKGATIGSPNDGDGNAPHISLANRTQYLKEKLEALALPEFGYFGKGYFGYHHAEAVALITTTTYDAPSGLFNSDTDNVVLPIGSFGTQNPSFPILQKTFKMPYGFTKLDLTYLARADINTGSDRGIRTMVLPWSATVDSFNNAPVDHNVIDGLTLQSAPTIRTIQLDLSAVSAGTKLVFIQVITAPSVTALGVDFTINFGQLRSSWSN